MDEIHIWINSIVLIVFGYIIYVQKESIKTLKTTIDAIDVRKIRESKELIIESIREQHKVSLEKAKGEIAKEVFDGYQTANSKF